MEGLLQFQFCILSIHFILCGHLFSVIVQICFSACSTAINPHLFNYIRSRRLHLCIMHLFFFVCVSFYLNWASFVSECRIYLKNEFETVSCECDCWPDWFCEFEFDCCCDCCPDCACDCDWFGFCCCCCDPIEINANNMFQFRFDWNFILQWTYVTIAVVESSHCFVGSGIVD